MKKVPSFSAIILLFLITLGNTIMHSLCRDQSHLSNVSFSEFSPTSFNHELYHLCLALDGCLVQRRLAFLVLRSQVIQVINQQLGNLRVPVHACMVQRLTPRRILSLLIEFFLKFIHTFFFWRIIAENSLSNWCWLIYVAFAYPWTWHMIADSLAHQGIIHVRAYYIIEYLWIHSFTLQQFSNCSPGTLFTANVQRCHLGFVPGIHIHSFLDQEFDYARPMAHIVLDLFLKLADYFVQPAYFHVSIREDFHACE